ADLRKEAGELLPPRSAEPLERVRVAQRMAAPERARPEPEGQDALALVRAAQDQPQAVALGVRHHLLDEPGLAESRLAEDRDHARVALGAAGELGAHARELGVSADERRVDARLTRGRRGVRGPRGREALRRALEEDLPVELLRLRLGLDPQLAPQR